MRVLIVDDEESLVTSLTMVLGESGFSVDAARSAPGAIARLESNTYDAAIIDKNLPDLSGAELVHYIREHHGDLPVLMITAFASASNAKEMLNLGVDDYLEKPFFDIYSVVSSVRDAVKKRGRPRRDKSSESAGDLLVVSKGARQRFACVERSFEMVSDASALSAAVEKRPSGTVVIDTDSFPAQGTVDLVVILRRQSSTTRIVVFSDVHLKVPFLKNLIGAGVDGLAESVDELRRLVGPPLPG